MSENCFLFGVGLVKKLTLISAAIVVVLLICGIWKIYAYNSSRNTHALQIVSSTRQNLTTAAEKIDELTTALEKTATEVSLKLSETPGLLAAPIEHLNAVLASGPAIFGIGFIEQSLLTDPGFRQKTASYVSRWENHQLNGTDVLPLIQKQVFEIDGSGVKTAVGAVVIDTSRQYLQNFINSMRIGRHGYPFILASQGSFICHPSERLLQKGKTIYNYAEEDKIASLADMGKAAEAGQAGCFDLYSDNTGNAMWGMVAPVPGKKWAMAMMMLKEPVLQASQQDHQQLFTGTVCIIVSVSLLLLMTGLALSKDFKVRLWLASSLFSAGLAVGILVIWFFNLSYRQYSFNGEIPLTDSSILEHYLDDLSYHMVLGGFKEPRRIPTGVFIQSIDFQSAVNLKVTGYVWQKFKMNDQEPIEEGLVFPDAQEITIDKAYEKVSGNIRTIGWNFQLILREGFDYLTYPFDLENVWLRMWPKEFHKNIVLVPDFDSYLVDDPDFLPGIDSQLVLPGWKILQSSFSYLPASYNTNFGISNFAGTEEFPELRFNVVIQRNFIDPFISIILPLLVVVILVFILLLTCSREESLKELFGFSAGGILSGIAALFFVVIFAQIDLRTNLEVERIMYMDFYYFVIYLVFMVVSVNSVLFCWPRRIAFIHFEDNLLPKLLYWPLILGTIFLTTIAFFFP